MRAAILLMVLLSAHNLMAQRVFERDGHVIYQDSHQHQMDLGIGSKPVLTATGRVLIIRGQPSGPNTDFDCADKAKKNWITLYNPISGSEVTLFDAPVHYDDHLKPLGYCIFDDEALSPDGQILYLVAPVYATSGKLAIIRLHDKSTSFAPGVLSIYVIEDGPHRGELIFSARRYQRSPADGLDYPYNPLIHARADGREIKVISDEFFADGGLKYARVPVLSAYLKQLGGHITVAGERLP